MEQKKTQSGKAGGLSGLGIAAIAATAAAAAGAIYLYGTDAGKKKRKQIKSWSLKMQADVMDKMAGMKEWSEEAYNNVVDTVADKYKNLKNIDTSEVMSLVADLKKHWKTIRRQTEQTHAPKRKAKKKTAPKKSE